MDEELEAFLEHVGVKGMKWGQRKDGSPSARRHLTTLTKPEKVVYTAAAGAYIAAKILQKVGPTLASKALSG